MNKTYEIVKNAPVPIGPPATTTTIAQDIAEKAADTGGPFSFLGKIIGTVGPFLPWVLGAAFIGVLLYFAWTLLNKGGKPFQKDYDKEAFKLKLKGLTRNPSRVGGGGGFFIAFLTLALVVLCVVVQLGLLFLLQMPLSFTPPIIVIVAGVIGGMLLTSLAEGFFKSYPVIVNKNRELVGYMLSTPQVAPEGFLDVLMFKRKTWLFFKDKEILSVPLNASYKIKVRDKKTGEVETKEVFVAIERGKDKKGKPIRENIPVSERYKLLPDGTLLLNSTGLLVTRFYAYPLYGTAEGDVFDFREVVFMRESNIADLNVSLYDVANISRENAVVLSGGNPWRRLAPERDKSGEDND